MGIEELKRRLSELIRQVEGGIDVLVTRHNKPVVHLTSAESAHLHRGRYFGRGKLKPAIKAGSQGAYLKVLEEDRRRS